LDDVPDRVVLGGAQLRVVDPSLCVILARFEQLRRAQQAADMVGAKRRLVAHRHRGAKATQGRLPSRRSLAARIRAIASSQVAAGSRGCRPPLNFALAERIRAIPSSHVAAGSCRCAPPKMFAARRILRICSRNSASACAASWLGRSLIDVILGPVLKALNTA